jgi:CheY-like chemotaxis protein
MDEPLSIRMASGPLSPEEIIRIGRRAAAALHEVHGELWPSAIVMSESSVVIEMRGLSERARYAPYSAPEVILGKSPTPASDVFSLGAILFHALTGHAPFRGDTPTAIMLAVCTNTRREMPAHVPRDLALILERCLMSDPSARFPAPAVLRHALEGMSLRDDAWRGRRLLLADDEEQIRDFYSSVAAEIGVVADVVSNGRDVIGALKARRYDVAFVDLNMPRVSGWDVLDYLRTHAEARPKRLFIITGLSGQALSTADRELVTAMLYKPVDFDELRDLVTACLRGGDVDLSTILRTTSHRVSTAA